MRRRVTCGNVVTTPDTRIIGADGQELTGEAAQAELRARPDVMQMIRTYEAVEKRIRSDLRKAELTGAWAEQQGSYASSSCAFAGDATGPGAESRSTQRWTASAIPDSGWDRAQKLVRARAAEAGFTELQTLEYAQTDHYLRIIGRYGAELRFESGSSTTLNTVTGCHRLPENLDELPH